MDSKYVFLTKTKTPHLTAAIRRSLILPLALFGALAAVPAAQAAIEVRADFNGDGFEDLAIGAPGEGIVVQGVNMSGAGAVNVIYGTAAGLGAVGNQFWFQELPGIAREHSEPGDSFGDTLAAGDFNGDGFADLAIGAPFEDLPSGVANAVDAGAVHVLYGSAAGLSDANDQIWDQDSPGTFAAPATTALFGGALAAGDFNADGRDDLAIGVSGQNIQGNTGAGGVQILLGSVAGLTTTGGVPFFTEDTVAGFGASQVNDRFGRALAAGDFNGDGRDDLAIGVPFENLVTTDTGLVWVVYGSTTGLNSATSPSPQPWHQDAAGIEDSVEPFDQYGSTLAAGDFNGDGHDDLAVGIPLEDLPIGSTNLTDAGAVNVIYGTSFGLTATGDQLWHQDVSGVKDNVDASDFFGGALTAGDFNGDGRDDLAVGVRGEDFPGFVAGQIQKDTGAVNVLYGTATGLSATNNQLWHQDAGNIDDVRDDFDSFGTALTAGDFNGDGRDDLAVGVPREDLIIVNNAEAVDAGAVNVIYGTTRTGLDHGGIFPGEQPDQLWHQNVAGILDQIESNDRFGASRAGF